MLCKRLQRFFIDGNLQFVYNEFIKMVIFGVNIGVVRRDTMKNIRIIAVILILAAMLAACSTVPGIPQTDEVCISLSDTELLVDGKAISKEASSAVYVAQDIVYYEAGKDFTYGEGTEKDAHSPESAAAHQVVHITQPGIYRLSGKLSLGQIAVDLGEDAKTDPNAVVTLVLDGVDITCEVAPAVIFYRVYECGDPEKASRDVDTTGAGANVVIADGSENFVRGSYVARIYKPESVVLNGAGTAVEDAKKLHKYDGAFYSKMSMNINGEKKNNGVLRIYAENEGMDSEMHLTVNGGNIYIESGNDGINTNEDGVSVTTVNGGSLAIRVTGETGEGDGIDSNGWLVINGGTVIAQACSASADAGIDSDMGIHINGGTVMASGNMLDHIEDGGQTYAVFNFAERQNGMQSVVLKNEKGKTVMECSPKNAYSILIYSSPDLKPGTYTLWSDGRQLAGQSGGMMGGDGMMPGGMMPPEDDRSDRPAPQGNPPEGGMEPPGGFTMPAGQEPPRGEMPAGGPGRPMGGEMPGLGGAGSQEISPEFVIASGANMFMRIAPVE